MWVRNGRGLVHHDRGDYAAALADFNEAAKIDPDHAATYEYRAETLYKLGRKAEALADVNEAIKRNPDSLRLFNRRAMLHYFNKEYSKAVRDHTAALKCDPNHAATFNYLAWVWATAPDPTVRNGRRALECATLGLRVDRVADPRVPGHAGGRSRGSRQLRRGREVGRAGRRAGRGREEPDRVPGPG